MSSRVTRNVVSATMVNGRLWCCQHLVYEGPIGLRDTWGWRTLHLFPKCVVGLGDGKRLCTPIAARRFALKDRQQ